MSKLNVNAIEPSTGTDITLGASGDTTTVPTGAGLTVTDEVKTNKISPATGTALALGDSGDTITVPSGATFTQSGTMNASAITAGTMATARLGSGTASSTTVLYGDQTYKTEPTGGKVLQVVTSLVTGKATMTSTDYTIMQTSDAITCSATSSKVLVMICTSFGNDVSAGGGSNANFRFARAIDGGTASLIFADPMYNVYGKIAGDGAYYSDLATVIGIDAPASTGALTYSIAGRRIDGSAIPFIGGRGTDASYAWGTRFVLTEIGA